MRCDEVRENLVAYLDGEVSPEERERIDSHLAGCAECREERTGLGSTGDLLGVLSRTESAPDLAGRVLREAQASPAVEAWCRHIRRGLVPFLDRELSDVEARPVRDHLAECEGCRKEARALGRTGDLLEAWTVELPRVDIAGRIVPCARRKKGRRIPMLPLAVGAAALFLALAAGALLGLFGGGSAEDSTQFAGRPPRGVLESLEVLDTQTLDLLDHDVELLELAEDLDWLESVSEEELASLEGSGG